MYFKSSFKRYENDEGSWRASSYDLKELHQENPFIKMVLDEISQVHKDYISIKMKIITHTSFQNLNQGRGSSKGNKFLKIQYGGRIPRFREF